MNAQVRNFAPSVGKARVNWDTLPDTDEALDKLKSLRARLAEEQTLKSREDTDRFAPFELDPVGFVTRGLGGHLWSKQQQVAVSVRDNRRTAVPSCHDVGKSATAGRIAAWWVSSHAPGEAFVVSTAPTGRQVKNILWREIGRVHRKGGLPGRCLQMEWYIDGEIVAFGVSPADDDPTAMQGIHAKYVLVIIDEACGVAKALWQAADSLIANDDSRILAIGNADDPTSEFANVCKPGSGWNVINISAFDSPNMTGEDIPDYLKPLLISPTWVKEKRRTWGEGSPLWKAKILGEFPDQAEDGVIRYSDLRKAVERSLKPKLDDANELGVDVARFGSDNTVIYHRKGPVARKRRKVNGNDTAAVTEMIMNEQRLTGATRIKVDDSGIGGGVTDQLRKAKRDGIVIDGVITKLPANVEIVPINVGEAPATESAGEKFKNLRAELHWAMRLRFMDGDIDLDEEDPDIDDLLAQASSIKYKQNARGQILIESKDDIKKRGLPSPDDFEALMLAYAKPNFIGSGFLEMARMELAEIQRLEAEKAKKKEIA